jgi:hypothetical protein
MDDWYIARTMNGIFIDAQCNVHAYYSDNVILIRYW